MGVSFRVAGALMPGFSAQKVLGVEVRTGRGAEGEQSFFLARGFRKRLCGQPSNKGEAATFLFSLTHFFFK